MSNRRCERLSPQADEQSGLWQNSYDRAAFCLPGPLGETTDTLRAPLTFQLVVQSPRVVARKQPTYMVRRDCGGEFRAEQIAIGEPRDATELMHRGEHSRVGK
jgi:hypothetical protein